MLIFLEAIKLNHDPLSATVDAINIRKNEKEPITVPEWQRLIGVKAPESLPAAYAISETLGNRITIQAKFRRLDSKHKSIEIRAIDPTSNGLFSEVEELVDAVFSWLIPSAEIPTRNVLGSVKRKQVTFLDDDVTSFETFELDDVRVCSAGVSKSTTTWHWQYRVNPQSPWITFEKSCHQIYTMLKMPKAPWLQYPGKDELTQLPWAEVLDYACEWAHGAKNIDEAARLVTHGVRKLEERLCFFYDPNVASYSNPNFDCTNFLDLLRGGKGNGLTINCSDCAAVVSSFANILGCDLWQSQMGNLFFTNPVRGIGSTCWKRHYFNYHEVAWTGACTEDDEIFDACLQLDSDSEPNKPPHTPTQPAGLRFGGETEYRFRLRKPDQVNPNTPQPKPGKRQHRPLRPNPSKGAKRTDTGLLRLLLDRYGHDLLRQAPQAESLFVDKFCLRENDFSGWKLHPIQCVKTANWPPVIQSLWTSVRTDALMRADVYSCRSSGSARYFLLQTLGQIESATVEQHKDLGTGELAFMQSENGTIVFVRANLVVIVRNVGRFPAEPIGIARRLDQCLIRKPDGEDVTSMKQFSIYPSKIDIGDRTALISGPEFPMRRFYRFLGTAGVVRRNRRGLIYHPDRAGPQQIIVFALNDDGTSSKQILTLT